MQAGAAGEKEKAKASDKPLSVIMATTDDGRRVLLMPDGTWHFVEGAPEAPKPKTEAGNRDKLWADLVTYFSDKKMSQVQKESFLLQTEWHKVPRPFFASTYNVKVSVQVNEDCSLNITKKYQVCDPKVGCNDFNIENCERAEKIPLLGEDCKKLLDFDSEVTADLKALEAKYRQK
jgi:hypothetical protein